MELELIKECEERKVSLLDRLLDSDMSGVDDDEKMIFMNESMNLTYYELRQFLTYLNKYVSNSTTRSVINELIKVLVKLEMTATKLPNMTKARVSMSKQLIRY